MKTITLEVPDNFPVMVLATALHGVAARNGHELKANDFSVWTLRPRDAKPVLVRVTDPDNRDPGDEQPQPRADLRIVKNAAVIAA